MDWGVPDWRVASLYPEHAALTKTQWLWEFTRRRPDFRLVWQEAWPAQQEWADAHMDRCRETADRDGCTLEASVEWLRCRHIPAGQRKDVQRRFRLSAIPDPRKSYTAHFLRHVMYFGTEVCSVSYGSFDAVESDQKDPFVLIRFNLDLPLEKQLEFAKTHFLQLQMEKSGKALMRRPRHSNWPLFLRALDARDASATYADMAASFWPRQEKTAQSARDTHDAACQLRDNFPL